MVITQTAYLRSTLSQKIYLIRNINLNVYEKVMEGILSLSEK